MLTIEKAVNETSLGQVRQLLWEYARLRNFDQALGDYKTEFEQLPGKYAPPDGCLLLASIAGQAAGCVAYRQLDDEYCEMKRLYVSPAFRTRRIGKALVEQLILSARARPYRYMRLDSHPWMVHAQRIYEHFDFRPIAAYNDNPTPGILFFEKAL